MKNSIYELFCESVHVKSEVEGKVSDGVQVGPDDGTSAVSDAELRKEGCA